MSAVIPSNGNGNGRKSVAEVISDWIPILLVLGSVGGMALVPLYIKSDHNEQKVEALEKRFNEHEKLPGHPVYMARLEAEIRRLDDRITVNDKWTSDVQITAGNLAGAFQAEKSRNEISLIEIETQFRASDEFRNVNLAGQMRFNSLMWQQIFGVPFPMEVYFPSISKQSSK